MPREKRTLTVEAEVDALLARVGNASEYVSRVVEQRWHAWTSALATLRAAGWLPGELLAACDVLNGYWLFGDGRRGSFVAVELHDGQRLNSICEKWEVPPARWAERIKQVAEQDDIAYALVTLVQEFWTNNEACEAAIRRDAVGKIISGSQQSSGLREDDANALAVQETRVARDERARRKAGR